MCIYVRDWTGEKPADCNVDGCDVEVATDTQTTHLNLNEVCFVVSQDILLSSLKVIQPIDVQFTTRSSNVAKYDNEKW